MPNLIRAHLGKLLLTLLLMLSFAPHLRADQGSAATKQIDLRNLPTAQTEGAGTGTSAVLSTALTTGPTGGRGIAYRVTVCVTGTDSTFGIDFDDDGTLPPQLFDRGTALVADCLYTFVFEATEDDEVNFTFGSTTTIVRLIVSEIRGGEL